MNLVRISSALFGVLGISGVSLYGTYEATKETFLDTTRGSGVVSTDESEKESEAWISLTKSLKEKAKSEASSLSKEFLDLKDVSDSGEKLRQLCKKISKITYKTIFNSKVDANMAYSFATFCQTKFWNVLGSEKTFENANSNEETKDKEKVKDQLNKLKTHDNNDENGFLDQAPELKAIKEKSGDQNAWKDLFDWCQNKYDENYSKRSDNSWKLVKKYCVKD